MRHELSYHEWTAIGPMLSHKPRGVPRVNDCRVSNSIFLVLRSDAPWRGLPERWWTQAACRSISPHAR
jgi:transposase